MFPLQKDIWTEVISLYKNMPFLWDKSDPQYTSRHSRNIGYNIILQKYREHDKHATMASLKKKIDNMRTSYRRELKKVLQSKRNGVNDDELYIPELWYYDSLSFLNENIAIQYDDDSSDGEYNENSQTSEQQSYTDDSLKQENITMDKYFFQDNVPSSKRKRIKRDTVTIQEDDWLVVGKSIGIQLKGVDAEQSAIAQKVIAETLFYAKLGKLNEYSSVSLNELHNAQPNDSNDT